MRNEGRWQRTETFWRHEKIQINWRGKPRLARKGFWVGMKTTLVPESDTENIVKQKELIFIIVVSI